MCGRYTVVSADKIVRVFFNVTMPADLRAISRYNIAPTQDVLAIINGDTGDPVAYEGLRRLGVKNVTVIFSSPSRPSRTPPPTVPTQEPNVREDVPLEEFVRRYASEFPLCK